MVIITESLYHAKSSEEIVKRISEITPLPESLSINGPYAKFISKSLIKSIAIYEFHESKLLEASEYIAKCVFRSKVTTHSVLLLPPIPLHCDHPFRNIVTTCSARLLPL